MRSSAAAVCSTSAQSSMPLSKTQGCTTPRRGSGRRRRRTRRTRSRRGQNLGGARACARRSPRRGRRTPDPARSSAAGSSEVPQPTPIARSALCAMPRAAGDRSGARSDQLTTHSNVPDFLAILTDGNAVRGVAEAARQALSRKFFSGVRQRNVPRLRRPRRRVQEAHHQRRGDRRVSYDARPRRGPVRDQVGGPAHAPPRLRQPSQARQGRWLATATVIGRPTPPAPPSRRASQWIRRDEDVRALPASDGKATSKRVARGLPPLEGMPGFGRRRAIESARRRTVGEHLRGARRADLAAPTAISRSHGGRSSIVLRATA